MQIFFDHQTFSQQSYGGISRYYAELISGINSTQGNDAYLPLIVSNNIHLQELGIHANSFFSETKIPKKVEIISYFNKLFDIYKIKKGQYDIFHATYYDPYFIPYLKGRPFVVTFLDMIHEKFGSHFSELAYDGEITRQKKLLADKASRIIAISESTKRDVVDLLDIDPEKIDVIYLGSSFRSEEPKRSVSKVDNPYLLFVGNRGMYKNFKGLLEAIHPLLKQYKIKLFCAGGGSFTKEEKLLIKSFKADEFVEQYSINDQTLAGFYQNALAFVFPSLYEGFGIPILEAFACQCPCILSSTSSLPEVAGNAAYYFNPQNKDEIANAVEAVITNQKLRDELVSSGSRRLTEFSWSSTVEKTLRVYKQCLSL